MSARVNKPTDVKVKEADVNRKLQLYGIVTAFSNGKVPSNEQIDIALNSFLKSKAMSNPSTRLSAEGRALVADFRDVVKQAQHLLLSKNQGDLLQDFIWQSQKIDGGVASVPGAPVDKDAAKQHGNEALEGLRTLGTLIISNGQFRKLLNDATILVRDIAGDAAQKAANQVNPSDEQLSQIDKPAADNTWHDVPDLSTSNIKQQLKSTYNKNGPVKNDDLKEAVVDASQAANPDGSRDPNSAAQYVQKDAQQGTDSGVDANAGAKAGLQSMKQKAHDNVPEETKEQARARQLKTRQYLQGKMPEERREQTIWRLRKMVVEIQGHSDYQQAIDTLLKLAETYAGHANTVAQQSGGAVKGARADNSLQKAENDLKTLIERFANSTSANDLFESINQIYRDADQDPELKSWFKKTDSYVRKCLQQQGYIMEDRATEEWNGLYDHGEYLLRGRYRNHTNRIVDEIRFLVDQFDKDPLNKRFAESINKLFKDLGNDENGKPTFKPHLMKDLTEVIVPSVFENINYIPIPRIEVSDPMIDVVVENLIIESDNLMPNVLEIANDNYFKWGRKAINNKNSNSVMVSVAGIQMDLKDVAYYVKKKQGFPSVTDLGVADIFLGGSGLSFKMKLSTTDKTDRQNFFKVEKVDVDVQNFDIKLKKSNHKLLFALAKPLMLKVLRPALQKAIEKVIKDKAHELDSLAYEIKKEVDRAQKEVIDHPEDAPNIYNRYYNAFQKKLMQGRQEAEKVKERAKDTKINTAVTKQDSIFPDIHLPGGISSKATEYKELAQKGEEWRSPIFKLGSADVSSDIPKATGITRKDHSVTEGGVRGKQNAGNTESMSNQLHNPSAISTGQSSNGFSNTGGLSSKNVGIAQTGDYTPASTYPNNTTLNPTKGNGNGFSQQVDKAFTNDKSAIPTNGHTTLGSNNPVLTGKF
ncbi:hypothetical protein BJ878DRAFT_498568 [Calycina marina]|uniref:Uncharacterized protein n=1 Tax=Calycina marina TaxID=1763456 RepID=A0A9P7Z6B8_9HELO|nr:hypothetical protein BJ878DRAFT_498568 [Calycina marina]